MMINKIDIENHFRGDYIKFYSRYLSGEISPGGNGQAMTICPFHEDQSPSLSINMENGLYNCFGCGAAGNAYEFYAKAHSMTLPGDFAKVLAGIASGFGIQSHSGSIQAVKPIVTARYDYKDESGNLLYQIERLDPKSFRIRRPDGNGKWIFKKDDVRIVPYRLPEILKADGIIIIVEGEKDADSLSALEFVATCNPFGAGKWPEDFGQFFKDKTVIIVPDNDAPGRSHARQVYKNLKQQAWEIKYLELPELPEKGDVSDFIKSCANKTEAAERLSALIEAAPLYTEDTPEQETSGDEKQKVSGFHFRSVSDLCAAPTTTKWLIKNYLDAEALAELFGDSGSMKSFVAVDTGLSIAILRDWHGHEVRSNGAVFYIAGEGFSGINRRIKAWSIYHDVALQDIPFFVSDRAAQFLDDPTQVLMAVDDLRSANGEPILIIIDTLSRNFGSGDENSTQDMARFINVIDDLRNRYHCAVLIVHHSGLTATDRARGASALRAALDWEYRLQKKADGTLILTCTKCKDHEEPDPICFEPEIITLEGWVDPDDCEVMTSCVMVRTDSDSKPDDSKPLTGPRKIAYDAFVSIGKEKVHIDTWRDAAYSAGISTAPSIEAKKKAFQRALTDLREKGYIETKDNLWWLGDKGQQRDIVGTCPKT